MGLFDDVKQFVTRAEDTPPVDIDTAYSNHRSKVAFELSPAGQVLREVAVPEEPIHLEAQLLGNKEPKPDSGGTRTDAEIDAILAKQAPQAAQTQETNRQGMLAESMGKAQPKPTVLDLETVLNGLDYPASKVREAIAAKVSAQTGAKVTADNLGEYVGARTAPGDPIGQAVNSVLTGIATDPLTFLPGLGIPASSVKQGVKGIQKIGQSIAEASKGAGVDLATERGSVSFGKGKQQWYAQFPGDIAPVGPFIAETEQEAKKLIRQTFPGKPENVWVRGTGYDKVEIARVMDELPQVVYKDKIQQFAKEVNTLNTKTLNDPKSLAGGIVRDVESSLAQLPRIMLESVASKATEQTGSTSLTAALMLTRAAVGGLAGAKVGDEDDAIRNAFIGAGLGAVASPKLIKEIANKVRQLHGVTAPTPVQQAAKDAQAAVKIKGVAQFREDYQKAIEKAKRLKPGEHARHDVDVKAEANADIEYGRIDRDKVASLYPGQALNDNQLTAAAEVVSASGKQLIDMAAMAIDDASKDAVIEALFEHGKVLDAKFVGAVGEVGRTLRITGVDAPVEMQAKMEFIRDIRGIATKTGVSANRDQVIEALKQLKTPEQLALFSKNIVKPGLTDAWMSLWINSLLSGPQTHVANIMGNGATLTWGIAERQLAGLLGGDVHPGEASAMVQGVFESFGDALQLGAKAFMTNETTFAGSKMEQAKHISAEDLAQMGVVGRSIDYLSNAFSYTASRPLVAADEFFKAISFRAEVRARARREAHAVIASEGLTGKAARDKVKDLTNEYLTNIPADIKRDAEHFAAYTTFTKALGPSGAWLQEGAGKIPAVKLVVPFIRTPINIFKFAGERTPFALFTKSMWTEIQAGGARQELALAKVATGSMIAATGVLWAANGFITGGGPNPKKFNTAVSKEGGWQPYSVNVSAIKRASTGGSSAWQKGDKMVAYNRIEPLGMLLGMYANYVEVVSNAEHDSDYEELAMQLTMSTVKTMSSKTFIKGLSQTALAFAYPEEFLGDTLTRQAVSFVPVLGSGLSRSVTRQVDPVVREAEGFIEELMKNTPGLSDKLPPTLDLLHGEPVYREGGVGPDIASPLYQSTYKDDRVVKEIERNKVNVSKPSGIVHGVELSTEGKNELQHIITHDVKMGGRNLHASLEHLIDSNVYKNGSTGPDGRRALLIKAFIHKFQEAGQMKLLKKHPELRQQVKDMQRAHADRMKSVRPLPDDAAIDAADQDLEVAGF